MTNSNAGMINLVLIIAMIAILYFLMIRPQRKRDKEMQDMRSSLVKGDEIVTIGGIICRVDTVKEDSLIVTINSSHTRMEILKTAVGNVRQKSESKKPAKEKDAPEEKDERPVTNNKKVTPKKLGGRKASDDNTEAEKTAE